MNTHGNPRPSGRGGSQGLAIEAVTAILAALDQPESGQ